MGAEFLDYGALGLLALALGAVGLWLRGYLNRVQESQAERERLDREDRTKLTNGFQDLLRADVEAKQALTGTLEDLCEEVRACGGTKDVLDRMLTRMDQHEKRADARFRQSSKESAERHGEILAALRALNGKR